MSRFLASTGIEWEPDVVGDTGEEAGCAFPAATPDCSSTRRRRSESNRDARTSTGGCLDLLPVLTVALARAVEHGDYARCAYCGRLAHVVGNRPDPRRILVRRSRVLPASKPGARDARGGQAVSHPWRTTAQGADP